MSLADFQKSLFFEDDEKVKEFLVKYDVNKPEDEFGCKYTTAYLPSQLKFGKKNEKIGYATTFMWRRTWYFPDNTEGFGEYIPWTPLQYVSAIGNERMVRFLLSNGADPTINDKTGRDALLIAKNFQRNGVIQILQEFVKEKSTTTSNSVFQSHPQLSIQSNSFQPSISQDAFAFSSFNNYEFLSPPVTKIDFTFNGVTDFKNAPISDKVEPKDEIFSFSPVEFKFNQVAGVRSSGFKSDTTIQFGRPLSLAETNFSEEYIRCTDGKVFVHKMVYLLCPELKQQHGVLNYEKEVVEALRHFLYTAEVRKEIGILACVQMSELSILLNLPQMMNRIRMILPQVLNTTNFEQGYKCALSSDHNEADKMNSLLEDFNNFYLDNKDKITINDVPFRKTLNGLNAIVNRKYDATSDAWGFESQKLRKNYDFFTVINGVKKSLWKTREYADVALVCTDNVRIPCHKAVISISPLFSKFDSDDCVVDFESKSLTLFLEILYGGVITITNVSEAILIDLYHLCNQSNFKELSREVVHVLKNSTNEKNCAELFGFYLNAHLEDVLFLNKLRECMKFIGSNELCTIYLLCREKNPEMVKEVVEVMCSKINQQSSSSWLAVLDEFEIDDQTLWEKLGDSMNPDTFHLWNIFQNKLTKERDRVETLEKKHVELEKSLIDRLEILEKSLNGTKK